MLKGYDKKGRRVFIFQMKNFDTEKLKVDDLYRTHFMMMEILMDSMDQSSVTGFVSIRYILTKKCQFGDFFSQKMPICLNYLKHETRTGCRVPAFSKPDLVCIFTSDVKDTTLSHVTAMSNPVTMKKSTMVFQASKI